MKIKKIIGMTLLAILISSCTPFIEREIGRCDLTEAQMQIIPYQMGQVVSFIDGAGQTVDLTITQNELGWNYDGMASSFHEEYLAYRTKFVTLKSETDNPKIYLHIFAGESLSGYDNCSLRIGITYSGGFIFNCDTEGNLSNIIGSDIFYHSLEINGKVYYDVIEQEFIHKDVLTNLLYSKTYGILQIMSDGFFLTLK